ncbi:MAG: MFS transporter [Acidimicrobiales bacterium]
MAAASAVAASSSLATGDSRRLLATRGVRALVDGTVATVLPAYLIARGLGPTEVGAVVTATLLGSAVVTLLLGLRGGHLDRVRLLRVVALVMVATGLAFGLATSFAVLIVIAALGTINPSGGDVSPFLPIEQSLLPDTVPADRRTHVFARYTVVASLAGSFGALAAGVPEWLTERTEVSELQSLQAVFLTYAAAGVVIFFLYRRLRPRPPVDLAEGARHGLHKSRAIVLRLAGLFSVDSFGGGFTGQAIIVLWLSLRYDMSTATAGAVFFWSGLLTASSALLAPRIADRIGLIRTMVYTHLPANGLVIAAALMPTVELAVACLLARALLSQMDVPTRTSYVMAVVEPEERAAAASVTNVPRSLASAVPPLLAGWMLAQTSFGWPLIIGGALKAAYDLALLRLFRDVRPPEEIAKVAQ